MPLSDGRVDPASTEEVAAVLTAVQSSMGAIGLADLLARLPGVTREAGSPRRLLRASVPDRLWLGGEDALTLGPPLAHEQIVGGVVLHRTVITPGAGPSIIAGIVVRLAGQGAAHDAVSLVLSAARDAVQRF